MNPNGTRDRIRWLTLVVLVGVTISLVVLDSIGSLDSVFDFIEGPFSSLQKWTTDNTNVVVDTLVGPRDMQAGWYCLPGHRRRAEAYLSC